MSLLANPEYFWVNPELFWANPEFFLVNPEFVLVNPESAGSILSHPEWILIFLGES
ncbi:hypothetical protein T484DRAFT_3645567, partial [Baffinella frigidus]